MTERSGEDRLDGVLDTISLGVAVEITKRWPWASRRAIEFRGNRQVRPDSPVSDKTVSAASHSRITFLRLQLWHLKPLTRRRGAL